MLFRLFAAISEAESCLLQIKEVLEALEELAINYDQKVEGLEAKSRDMAKLEEELNTAVNDVWTKDSLIEKLKEQVEDLRKKYKGW